MEFCEQDTQVIGRKASHGFYRKNKILKNYKTTSEQSQPMISVFLRVHPVTPKFLLWLLGDPGVHSLANLRVQEVEELLLGLW